MDSLVALVADSISRREFSNKDFSERLVAELKGRSRQFRRVAVNHLDDDLMDEDDPFRLWIPDVYEVSDDYIVWKRGHGDLVGGNKKEAVLDFDPSDDDREVVGSEMKAFGLFIASNFPRLDQNILRHYDRSKVPRKIVAIHKEDPERTLAIDSYVFSRKLEKHMKKIPEEIKKADTDWETTCVLETLGLWVASTVCSRLDIVFVPDLVRYEVIGEQVKYF